MHNFFQDIPLRKGAFFKATLKLNHTNFQITSAGAGGVLSCTAVTTALGGINPVMFASAAANNGNVATFGAGVYNVNMSVGVTCLNPVMGAINGVDVSPLLSSVTMTAPIYTFNSIFKQSYLSQNVKTVIYKDIYQYQDLNVGPDKSH